MRSVGSRAPKIAIDKVTLNPSADGLAIDADGGVLPPIRDETGEDT
jgi:hypothetical protein